MNTFPKQVVFIFLVCSLYAQGQEEKDDEDLSTRTFRFHRPPEERPCEYRRQQGFCKRRSQCRRPTRHTCRIGLNPIVCCLDEPHKLATTTEKPKITTKRPPVKPDSVKEIDITFPDCGSRSPKVPSSGREEATSRSLGRRGRARGIQPVVVGGVAARANSWPWMVAIFKEPFSGGTKRFLCGASLISRRYVLSAAHCFDGEKGNINPSKFFIIVGAHTTKDGTEYPVESIMIHPGYQQRQYYNDMSLLKVGKEVTLTKKVYPVCLPSEGLRHKIAPSTSNVTVTGWGDTSFGGVSSKVLHEVSMPIVPLKECNSSYSKLALSNFPNGITSVFICAGVKEGGKDACQGDSGGPMVAKLKDETWVQLGVVSFGYGCAQAGYPGVYSRTSEYSKWIYDNTDLGKA